MKKTEQKRSPAGEKPEEPAAGELLALEEIKELVELIAEKQFDEFELERGRFRIRIVRGGARHIALESNPAPVAAPKPAATASEEASSAAVSTAATAPSAPEEKLHLVTSPIVGTFYRAPSPTANPFVQLGDQVEPGMTLCIIEAMKLMNEIQSDVNGTIAKIFVENGQPVEYGQALFGIRV